jgi:acetyl-CoA/propionyl-CoA carboxylase biotin carboxyl carrier protein
MEKVIVWAPDREQARQRMLRALSEVEISGPATTIPFAEAVLRHPVFAAGEAGTPFVALHLDELRAACQTRDFEAEQPDQIVRTEQRSFEVEVNRRFFRVQVAEVKESPRQSRGSRRRAQRASATVSDLTSPMHGTIVGLKRSAGESIEEGETLVIIEAMKMENEVAAHRSGMIRRLFVAIGDGVEMGQRLAVIE